MTLPSSLEPLESRIAPAGVVTVTFDAGKLLFTGDAGNTQVTVTQSGPANFYLAGNAGTTFSTALPPGVFNPATGTFHGAVKDIAWTDAAGGTDALILQALAIPGSVTYTETVAGSANTMSITDARIGGSVVVATGSGSDGVFFFGDSVSVGRKMTLDLGEGGNGVRLDSTNLKVGGDLSFTSGAGNDSFRVNSTYTTIVGKLTGDAGAGANANVISGTFVKVGGMVSFANGDNATASNTSNTLSAIGGALTLGGGVRFTNGTTSGGSANTNTISGAVVRLGGPFTVAFQTLASPNAGDDTVTVNGSTELTIGGATTIAQGDGANSFSVGGGVVKLGKVTVTSGAGADDVGLSGAHLTIGGATRVSQGESANSFSISGTFARAGSVNVTSGAGDDSFSLNATLGTVAGAVTVEAGAGANNNRIQGGAVAVTGTVSFTNGDNATDTDTINSLTAHSVKIGGGLLLTNGNASGQGRNQNILNDTTTQISGPLMVTGGAGTDSVSINSPNFAVAGKTTAVLGDGRNTFVVGSSAATFGGPVAVTNGVAGSASSTILILPSLLKIAGAVTLTNGGGGTSIMAGGSIGGPVQIEMAGPGADSFSIGGLSGAAPLNILGALKITGASTGPSGGLLFDLTVGGKTSINLGNGATTITINDFHAKGAFDLTTGAAASIINLEQGSATAFPLRSIFDKIATITMGGASGDMLNIGNDAASLTQDENMAVFKVLATFDGGAGTGDIANVSAAAFGNLYAHPPATNPVLAGFETVG